MIEALIITSITARYLSSASNNLLTEWLLVR